MSEENPWVCHHSRWVYESAWLRLREDEVTRPDGQPGKYGVVEFRNHAVGVVPLTSEGDTFLVGQWRYTLGAYSWEIPEGGAPLGEPLLDAARRELREETGIEAQKWTYLGALSTSNSCTNETGCVFLAEDLRFGKPEPEGTERLQVKRVPLAEAYAMAMNGEITDALAIVGLARAWKHLYHGRISPVFGTLPALPRVVSDERKSDR
ncbi:MAG: NUDIX hydrolase [Candidatus Sericytochromatia bacterium]|nr:NUDIX hydrolase [Candidatus Sericytochromatia bacterium]